MDILRAIVQLLYVKKLALSVNNPFFLSFLSGLNECSQCLALSSIVYLDGLHFRPEIYSDKYFDEELFVNEFDSLF